MTRSKANSQSEIRFADIRPLGGKQSQGFEELCFQLLPVLVGEPLVASDRVEGRGGDGGVEAIAKTGAGMVVGLQCKYFGGLSKSQWSQIDKSVRTVVTKHKEIRRYLVCVPLNRTPAQIASWKKSIDAWKEIAPSMVIEWVGESELLGHLLKPDAAHLKTYWFSCPDFSIDWIATQTRTAIKDLHARYTPAHHQPTSAEKRLEFLTALPAAREAHRKQCSEFVARWRHFLRELPDEIEKLNASVDSSELQTALHAMVTAMREGNLAEQSDELVTALEELTTKAVQLVAALFPGDRWSSKQYHDFLRRTKWGEELEYPPKLLEVIRDHLDAQRQSLWILTGEAGTGKSHLLADLALKLLNEKQCCLLMIGERFVASATLTSQMPSLLNSDWSAGDLLACLSEYATSTRQPSFLMVDAINESQGRGLWRRELLQFVTLISTYPNVRLIVSCRTDCLDSALPQGIRNNVCTIEHHGFDLQFHEAVHAYFAGYQVKSPQFPTLNPEFQNPLFLKTLCEAYKDKTLPLGHLTFVDVLKAWEDRVAENIESRVDCSPRDTHRAIAAIVEALAQSNAKRITADDANRICLKHFPKPEASLSLYRNLNSEGLLQEVETQDQTFVRLQYERFSDIRIAQRALGNFTSKKQWLMHWCSVFLPSRLDNDRLDRGATPELTAYAMLLPASIGMELVECPIGGVIRTKRARESAKQTLWEAWLRSLLWRSIPHDDKKISRFFVIWANQRRDIKQVWAWLSQFACIPDHPLNADFLYRHLNRLELPVRERQWTIVLARGNPAEPNQGIVGPFLYWADAAVGKASEEQVRLAAQTLLWLTGSPNQELRNLATDVAIRLLVGCASAGRVCTLLLSCFWAVNDPYVKERLLAVMCGVLPRLNAENGKPVAEFILKHFWQTDQVPPHILQREYAAFVVRHACETGLLPSNHLTLLAPRPRKAKPTLWSEEQIDVYAKDSAYYSIASSLRPEEMGDYGDFGRYTMGTAVHHFQDDERAAPETKGLFLGDDEHDARFARRYIWQRIIELGWTPKLFSEFENDLGYFDRIAREKRTERISKKYQWIGLHEYLGHLSDSLLFREWGAPARPVRGAWELGQRDYHPELALETGRKTDEQANDGARWWEGGSPIPTLNSQIEKRNWVQSDFETFEPYLRVNHDQRRWVVLKNHLNFKENLGFGVAKYATAQMAQWIDVRVFLIPKSQSAKRLKVLNSKNFYGDGCDVPHVSQCWMTEYPWHPSFKEADEYCLKNDIWFRRLDGEFFYLPVCDISDDDRRILLPAPSLYKDLGEILGHPLSTPTLAPGGFMEIYDHTGSCIVKASIRYGAVLMIDEAVLTKFLQAKKLMLVWAVLSEKTAWDGAHHVGGMNNQSAVYVLKPNGTITGDHTHGENIPPEKHGWNKG